MVARVGAGILRPRKMKISLEVSIVVEADLRSAAGRSRATQSISSRLGDATRRVSTSAANALK